MEKEEVNIKINLHYFKMEEFNQPDLPESYKKMDLNLLMLLDNMRNRAGIPFKINSAYRSEEYNKKIGGAKNSSHCKGLAVDISATTSEKRFKILEAAIHFGIERIGIGKSFIHIDIDDQDKTKQIAWMY